MAIAHGLGEPAPFRTDAANAAWDGVVHGFLTHGAALTDHLEALLRVAPEHPLPHAAHGLLLLLLARRELLPKARAAHEAAERALAQGGAGARERHLVDALGAWLDGRPSLAADMVDRILADTPEDAFAVKMAHAIRFLLGDSDGMRRSLEAVLAHYADDHPARGYILGCYAFALEETGDYAGAEGRGRDGLDRAGDDAWGLHAVTHALDMRGRSEDGRNWLAPRQHCIARCNNFRYHVWWHYALFELDLGNVDRVLALYDADVRADRTDDYRDIANGASLLARLALEGVDVGERWNELADLAEQRIDDACLTFADLHYALALAGAGRAEAAERLARRIAADGASTDCSDYAERSRIAGGPAATGLNAFALGRYDAAYDALAKARCALQTIGGSHAQRDVFERLTIEAALKARRPAEARDIVVQRARLRGAQDRFGRERLALAEAQLAGTRAVAVSPLAAASG